MCGFCIVCIIICINICILVIFVCAKKIIMFEPSSGKFTWNKEAEDEDVKLEEEGENKEEFMARL